MKILLLNPIVDYNKQFGTLKDFYTPIPSIALANIGAVLLQEGFEVVGVDAFIECLTVEESYNKIFSEKPDVLGISLLTPCAPLAEKLLSSLRKIMPNLKVILGNIHASKFDQYYLENGLADFVVHHEGEATTLELMKNLRSNQHKKDFSKIRGISFLNNQGAVTRTSKRDYMDSSIISKLPYPAWELFPVDQFKPDIRLQLKKLKKKNTNGIVALPVLATRGCPHRCTFCSPINTIGNKYRMRSVESIADEIEHFYVKWGVDTFYYMDLTFPISEKIGIKFCDEIIKRNLSIQWSCETRVSCVTVPLLKKMKESGCARIDFGIECGNQKMLDSIKKGFTIQQVEDAVKMTAEVGIEAEGLFILGLPGETVADSWDTINFALSLNMDHLKFNLFVPYPGSELWDTLESNGELTNFDFNEYTSYPTYTGGTVPFVPKGRTHEELILLQKKAMRLAFFRKQVILRELANFKISNISQYLIATKALLFPSADTTKPYRV